MTKNEEIKIYRVLHNLKAIVTTEKELRNEVIAAFEDYDYKGVFDIEVEFEENAVIRAYANHDTAPTFYIEYKQINEVCEVTIVDVHI